MPKINPYLNFVGNTEEAFTFYKSVFGGEFLVLQRFKDMPDVPHSHSMPEEDRDKLMHVALPVGDTVLMGTDALESMGHSVTRGNNISLSVDVESKADADRIYAALGEGGAPEMPMQDMFWGAYFGMVNDRFGIKWMVSYSPKKE